MVNNSCQNQSTGAINLDHDLYNDLNDCWVRKKSQPQPLITLTATLHPDDYKALGFQPTSQQPRSVRLSAMADTGCQSCLASTTVLRRLGLNQKDLIPVTTRMHAANNSGIKILGAIVLRFSGTSQSGQTRETRQIVYITNDSNKLFLSRETCTALGIISGNFPTVGEVPQPRTANEKQKPSDAAEQIHLSKALNTLESAHHPSCNCPVVWHHQPNLLSQHSLQPKKTDSAFKNGSWIITSPVHLIHANTSHYPSWTASQCDS